MKRFDFIKEHEVNETSASSVDPLVVPARARGELFLISLLILFLELACIRWFPAHILFLTFFTNTVLLACFLGMSLGCLAARQTRNYLVWTPILLSVGFLSGTCMDLLSFALEKVVNVGNQTSPQMVFFGTEYCRTDLAEFAVPIEVIAGFYFVLITLIMVGPGQVLGRSLNQVPQRVQAYTLNILGSLAGIALFAACSWFQLGPLFWFAPIVVGLTYFLWAMPGFQTTRLGTLAAASLLLAPGLAILPGVIRAYDSDNSTTWSPYYRILYTPPPQREINVNLIGHQAMLACAAPGHAYALPHVLNRDCGGEAFQNVLIIGAGSGNDVARALQWGGPQTRIDAVEIDPVIFAHGKNDHPDRPYQDPRVTVHLDDGRNFLHSTDKQYDLVVFALVDSLVLHSGYSNIRLESYLFTEQAFNAVRQKLKPDGLFVMYNAYRQGWIVARLEQTLKKIFADEGDPIVMTMPYSEVVQPTEQANGFTFLLAGRRTTAMRQAFARQPGYWMVANKAPSPLMPSAFGPEPVDHSIRFGPARVALLDEPLQLATDDWPFLYLRAPMLPNLTVRGMLIMAALSLVMLYFFWPRAQKDGTSGGFDGRMFFLGAGFMLVETKAVVHMALLWGSTWMVNSVVFFAVLLMILGANMFVLRRKPGNLSLAFAGLLITLVANAVIPLEWFLGLSRTPQIVGSCLLVFTPILFAGVIFAVSFGAARQADHAFGWNIAGAMLGGLAENVSMLIGFPYLVLVAAGFYVLSALWVRQPPLTAAPGQAESLPLVPTS